MMIAQCVECDENIELGSQVRVGAKLTCHHCGARLEVVGLDPVEVDWAYDDEDDDDWDLEEDDLGDDDLDFADDLDDLEELDDFADVDDDLDDGR